MKGECTDEGGVDRDINQYKLRCMMRRGGLVMGLLRNGGWLSSIGMSLRKR